MSARPVTTIEGWHVVPGQVIKIHGRWMRVVRYLEEPLCLGTTDPRLRWALITPHNHDPRLASLHTPALRGCRRTAFIWADTEYKTREEPAPVWEWVTRKIEREALT